MACMITGPQATDFFFGMEFFLKKEVCIQRAILDEIPTINQALLRVFFLVLWIV